MGKKILVDTSAWILSFKRSGHDQLKIFLKEAFDKDLVLTSPLIMLELLQGCRTQKEFKTLKMRLESLENCHIENSNWESAYKLGFTLKRKGLTVPTIDIVIAFLSIVNECKLLHHDRHFKIVAENSALDAVDFMS